jgi:hypothetical protein
MNGDSGLDYSTIKGKKATRKEKESLWERKEKQKERTSSICFIFSRYC